MKALWDAAPRPTTDEWTMAQLAGSTDWRTVPGWLDLLGSMNTWVRRDAGTLIARLVIKTPPEQLPGLETCVRSSALQASRWWRISPEVAATERWPTEVLGLLSMHPSGYVREATLRRLDADPSSLPFVLLRLNDWVPPVRERAGAHVRERLADGNLAIWSPALPLVVELLQRSRADHTWLEEGVAAMLLSPHGRAALDTATRSQTRRVARWALAVSQRLSDADRATFIEAAATHPDPLMRLRAATMAREWGTCPGRAELLEHARLDKSSPVRRQAFYAALESPAPVRRSHLTNTLLDRAASMRHAARFYLREDAQHGAESFDARAFYIEALTRNAPPRPAVVAGLGECGKPEDVQRLTVLLGERSAVAFAAVNAVAALSGPEMTDWLLGLLHDHRPAVAKSAARALRGKANALDREALRTAMRTGQHEHTRRLAMRLLLCRHLFDSVTDALWAADHGDPSSQTFARDFVRSAAFRTGIAWPSPEQSAAGLAAIKSAGPWLEERTRAGLRGLMAPAGGSGSAV